MRSREFREVTNNSFKLLCLVFRHVVAAPAVSFVFSYATLLPGILLIVLLGQHLGRAACFTLVGFCGVFMGTRCLPPRSRSFGAIALTMLGLVYYSTYIAEWGRAMTYEGKIVNAADESLHELFLLAFGGLLATTLFLWLSSNPSEVR